MPRETVRRHMGRLVALGLFERAEDQSFVPTNTSVPIERGEGFGFLRGRRQKHREQSATNVAKRDENHRYFKGSTMSRNVRDEGVAGSNPATPTSLSSLAFSLRHGMRHKLLMQLFCV